MNIIQTTDKFILELYKNKKTHKKVHYKEKNKSKKQSPTLTLDQRPNFNNLLSEDMTEDDLQCCLGQRWRVLLGNLGSIVDIYQSVVTKKRYLPYVISSHSKRLNQVFNTHQTVSNVISLAVRVGLLYVAFEDASYTKGLAKEYYYNKEMERVIKQLLAKYNIKCNRDITNLTEHKTVNLNTSKYVIRFSSKLRIKDMTEEEALEYLNSTYNDLSYYQNLFDTMKSTYQKDRPEQQIKFVPTITRSKSGYITKIGIRATSAICNLKVHLNGNTEYKGILRDEYLDSIYGKGNWFENDVKSSVPRVAYLMKTGEWLDQSIDVYELIFKKFESAQERQVYKNFFMKLYFDREGQLFNHNKQWITDSIAKFGKGKCEKILKDAKKKVVAILGESLDSEIFYHESCIYGTFVNFLRSQGIEVVQIYDAFFSNVDTSVYNWKLKEIAEEYYNHIKSKQRADKEQVKKEDNRENKAEVERDNISMYIGCHIRMTADKIEYKLVKNDELDLKYKKKRYIGEKRCRKKKILTFITSKPL